MTILTDSRPRVNGRPPITAYMAGPAGPGDPREWGAPGAVPPRCTTADRAAWGRIAFDGHRLDLSRINPLDAAPNPLDA